MDDVRRRAGLRATPLVIVTALLAACSSGSAESGPDPRASGGESFEQHCADGRLAMVDVAAHHRGSAVLVTWAVPRLVAEARTYRVLRRSPGERWERVGQPRLPAGAPRRYLDALAPDGPLRYAVVEIDACGVGPICTPVNIGHRCAVAAVPAHGRV